MRLKRNSTADIRRLMATQKQLFGSNKSSRHKVQFYKRLCTLVGALPDNAVVPEVDGILDNAGDPVPELQSRQLELMRETADRYQKEFLARKPAVGLEIANSEALDAFLKYMKGESR